MSQITITSSNFNGYTGDITFYPYSGGSISYGSQVIPYTIETENFNGEYNIQLDYEGVEVNCGVQVGASPCVYITTDGATTDYSGLYTFIGYGYISYDSRVPDIDVICDDTNPISQALYFYNDGVNTYIIGVVDDIVARITELRITKYDSSFDAECGNTYSSFTTATTLAYPTYNSTHLFPSTGNYSSGVFGQGTYLLENRPNCQIVPDVDANAYIEDVIASGGTINSTINNAVNTLFEELKSAGIYSKMKAMYPYVGGTASSHAINATLDKTYDITWYGGLTHDISGTTGNGTNGYGNTHINNSITFSGAPQNISGGYYQNSLNLPLKSPDSPMGGIEGGYNWIQFYNDATNINERWGALLSFVPWAHSGDTSGNYIANRTGTTEEIVYRNGSLIITKSGNDGTTTGTNADWAVLATNDAGSSVVSWHSKQRFSFHFACEGLSNSEITTLDSIINTFQTSLGRNTY